MRVSAKELYGLRAMSEFARHWGQGPLSLAEVARKQGISQPYLEQIAIDLRRAGLLNSRRGAQGGYYLARAPEATTAGDVIRALEGSILPVQCVAEGKCTPCSHEDGCSARGIWEQVQDRLIETLDSITLADLEPHSTQAKLA
ncbi:MAG TPA: Rrf2 family transcriptional regulator [Anaerolineae bacterium]|nr:Rrf2 family transcriptional regulator [Anaerolineae bacterium]